MTTLPILEMSLAAGGVGLAMSGHCFGMCGALVSVVTMSGPGRPIWRVLLYNTGRVATYVAMGLVAGALGQMLHLLEVERSLRWVTRSICGISLLVMLGASLRLLGLIPAGLVRIPFPTKTLSRWVAPKHAGDPCPDGAKPGRFFALRMLAIGAAFGFLPCAATLGMLAGSVHAARQTGHWLAGGLVMFAFGLGTWPIMTGVPFLAGLARKLGARANKLAGALLLLLTVAAAWGFWLLLSAPRGCCHGG